MKLTSFRLKDKTHIIDMDSVGLITPEIEAGLPDALRERLQQVRAEDRGAVDYSSKASASGTSISGPAGAQDAVQHFVHLARRVAKCPLRQRIEHPNIAHAHLEVIRQFLV